MVWCANDAAWGGLSVLERLNPGNIRPWPCCQKLLTTVTKSNWAQEQPHWSSTAVLWTQRVDAPPPLHSNSCRARGVTIHPMLKCYFLGPKTPLDSADIRQHGPWNHATTWRSWSAPFKRHKERTPPTHIIRPPQNKCVQPLQSPKNIKTSKQEETVIHHHP